MAQIIMTLICEMDLVRDAISDLTSVREGLFVRHGDRFRHLARDIDRFAERPEAPIMHHLGEGVFTTAPPPSLMALLHRAKELGV